MLADGSVPANWEVLRELGLGQAENWSLCAVSVCGGALMLNPGIFWEERGAISGFCPECRRARVQISVSHPITLTSHPAAAAASQLSGWSCSTLYK